jgi:hypothetical protein
LNILECWNFVKVSIVSSNVDNGLAFARVVADQKRLTWRKKIVRALFVC